MELKTLIALNRLNSMLNDLLVKDVKQYGLGLNEFGVLELLYHKGPSNVATIKNKILVAHSSTTYLLDQLEQKSYIRRIQEASDKRKFLVELTKEGETLIKHIFPLHQQVIESFFSKLDQEELAQLLVYLKKLTGYERRSYEAI